MLCAVGTGNSMLSRLGESASPLTCPSALAAFLVVDGGTYTEQQALQDHSCPQRCAFHADRLKSTPAVLQEALSGDSISKGFQHMEAGLIKITNHAGP